MALQVPFVQKYCTCTDDMYNPTLIGMRQREFEELKLSGLSTYDALQKMGIMRLCCREALFNCCLLFLNDENVGRIVDDTGHLAPKEPGRISRAVMTRINTENVHPIEPKHELPGLP